MRFLFYLRKQPPPSLEGYGFSDACSDFIGRCLAKDPSQRPSARELLEHDFIRHAGPASSLQGIVDCRRAWREEEQRRKEEQEAEQWEREKKMDEVISKGDRVWEIWEKVTGKSIEEAKRQRAQNERAQ